MLSTRAAFSLFLRQLHNLDKTSESAVNRWLGPASPLLWHQRDDEEKRKSSRADAECKELRVLKGVPMEDSRSGGIEGMFSRGKRQRDGLWKINKTELLLCLSI